MGVVTKGDPEEFAATWLKDHEKFDLWRPWAFKLELWLVQRWYDDAFLVVRSISQAREWNALCLSASVLPYGRFVYWDVVDADRKWGSR